MPPGCASDSPNRDRSGAWSGCRWSASPARCSKCVAAARHSRVEERRCQWVMHLGCLRSSRGDLFRPAKSADAHAEQANASLERYPTQTRACRAANRHGVLRGRGDGLVARDRLEVVVTQLQADRSSDITLALQIARKAFAELRKDSCKGFAIALRGEVALKCCLAADRDRLAEGHHRALVAAVGRVMHPGPAARAEAVDQPGRIGACEI